MRQMTGGRINLQSTREAQIHSSIGNIVRLCTGPGTKSPMCMCIEGLLDFRHSPRGMLATLAYMSYPQISYSVWLSKLESAHFDQERDYT